MTCYWNSGGRCKGDDEALALDDTSFGDREGEGDAIVHGGECIACRQGGGGNYLDVGWGCAVAFVRHGFGSMACLLTLDFMD